MDNYTKKHLREWIERSFSPGHRQEARKQILSVLQSCPDLIEQGRSWPEILNLYQD